jgi:acyl-CoA reductase-like NAD-dependent aldehyde dehydrogenase
MDMPIFTFNNPATGEIFGEMPMTTPEAVAQAYRDLRSTFPMWSQKPVKERVRILKRFQEMMIDSLDEITDVITQDCGKSRQDSLIEVFVTADILSLYCRQAEGWLRRRRVSSGIYITKHSFVEYRPFGVVAVITPWNYPLALSLPPALAALLAGNTVILKPSEVTGATGELMERLFRRVPELAPYVRVVHGDSTVGEMVVRGHPDYIFLTGSTGTGRKVSLAAADQLIPIACELGGKDAMIVLEDADLSAAARWGVWGAFYNCGQTCMAVERVYVVEPVYDLFVHMVLEVTREVKIGYTPDLDSPYDFGPITDPHQLKVIRAHIEDAVDKGAKLLTGGQVKNMYVAPTVLANVDHGMAVMREETFGPLLPIMKVKDESEAIRMANDCPYGLGVSIWSKDINRAQHIARQVEAASIIINDTIAQFAIPMLPFGGIKQSGYGRVHGKEGLMQFTRPYTFAVGNPPVSWDIATIMRKPHHYRTGAALIHLLFGVTPRQRVHPIITETQQRMKQILRPTLAARIGMAILWGLAAGWLFK